MVLPLADMGDTALAVVEIVGIALDVLLTVGLFYVGIKASKIDKLEDTLSTKADALIAAKLESHTGPLRTSIDNLSRELQVVHRRLEEGEADKDRLGEKGQSVAIQIERLVGDIKEFIRTNFATREGLKEHETSVDKKFDKVNDNLVGVGKAIAVLTTKVEQRDR